ncbi:hypothetical protein BDN70DRAFT_883049 [Pholiota conissans]|uniref:Uncharacterized protein n=1 Tax=Pholiota conissans TaxID=109636 RepID=A0A9P5YUD7_9AGAR|nr:hypothetical protein BDN70DRAFT_883049 [Pholiota conissans]
MSTNQLSPTSVAFKNQQIFLRELLPPAPLRVRNRNTAYDHHPSYSDIPNRRKLIKHRPSPLLTSTTLDEVACTSPIPVILIFPLASTLPDRISGNTLSSQWFTGDDSPDASDDFFCLGTGAIFPWLRDVKNCFKPAKRTPNTLLTKRRYHSANLPPNL